MCGYTRINALTLGLKQLNVRAMSVILTEHRYRAYEPDQISRDGSNGILVVLYYLLQSLTVCVA